MFQRRQHATTVQPATLNTNTAEWYTPDEAICTLLCLAGPKDCPEESIPELGRFNLKFWVVVKPTLKIAHYFNHH